MEKIDLRQELSEQASSQANIQTQSSKKKMADYVSSLKPEIERALPSTISADRFVRMVLTTLQKNPQLQETTPISFLSAMMTVAQLGLEVGGLDEVYILPFMNKNVLEAQLVIGYRGLLSLAYRSGEIKDIHANTVYEKDEFYYEYGSNQQLKHVPFMGSDKGEIKCFYAYYKTISGGEAFVVMSDEEMRVHAKKYSKGYENKYSPWQTSYTAMGAKTCIRKLLSIAHLSTEVKHAIAMDGTIKTSLSDDMFLADGEVIECVA